VNEHELVYVYINSAQTKYRIGASSEH